MMAAVDLKEALEFDKELHSLYEAKLPVSASKISSLTKLAVKHAKQYKGVVYSIERFITKCPPELKLAGLYVVDSIARAVSKHPEEGESYIARFEERMDAMFPHLMQAPGKDKDRVKRTVGLWRKSKLFSPSVVEQVEKTYLQEESTPQPSTDALGVLAGLSAASVPAANTNADPRLSGNSSGGASTPVTAAAPTNALAGLDASSLLNALNTMNNQASTLPALGGLDLNSLLPLLQGAQQQQHSTISQLSSLLGLQGASIPGLQPGLQPGQLGQAGQIGQLGNLSDLLKSGNSPFSQNGLQQATTQPAGEGQGGFGASNGNAIPKQDATPGSTSAQQAPGMTGQTIAAAGMGLDWAQQSYSTPAIQHMSAAPPSSGSYGLHTATVASSLPSGFQSNNQSSATNTNAASAGFPQAHHAPQQPTGMPNIRPAWSTANNQESQSNTPIGRPIPVVGSEREGVAPLTPWKQAAAQGATPAQPGDCVPGYIDPQLPKDYMKILTRTVYVGGITPDITKEQIRDLFETIGRIDTVTVNYAKFNAFVKFLTRAEADLVKERFHKYMFNKSILKMGWGCGYGPKEFFDYTTGETLFPLSRMTETEKRTIATSPRGGGPIEGGMVVEEPDFGWPQKGEVCKGKYSHGQIPYAPGYMEAKQQKESGGFPQSAAAPPQFGGYATRPRPPMPGAFGAVQRPPFQPPFHPMHAAGGLGGRGADILVVADRQYDDRDDRDRWRNKQVQDRGEEHVVVLGGGDDEETTAEHDGANDGAGEDGMRRRDKFSNESQHGGPHDWYPRPGTEFGPDGYGPGPDMHMRPPPGFPHGMPPPGWRPGPFPPDYWGPPMPGHGWAGPPPGAGGPMGRKRQYSPDPDARDVRGEDDGERRRRSRWE